MSKFVAFVLTFWGVIDLVIPRIHTVRLQVKHEYWLSKGYWLGSLRANAYRYLIPCRRRSKSMFLDLPLEIRLAIYDMVCWPDVNNGSIPGALHVLLLNKTIYQEARLYFERIPHTVILADGRKLDNVAEIWGMPRRIDASFHHSIQRLTIVLSICSIGKMSPDTFDVNIPKTSRAQWYNLKKAVGIWPEVREEPLEEIRMVLRASSVLTEVETYRAELIRYIRNFKRTTVWADSGTCANGKGPSLLLPLARAFNEARKNWIEEADFDNNLLIRFGEQKLNSHGNDAKLTETWTVQLSNDTSRTDNREYPPLTEIEEGYIRSKMERNVELEEPVLCCQTCLAHFPDRRVYLEHVA